MSNWKSHVHPHSKIQLLADNLWSVTGRLPSGPPLPRNMVIFRLGNGDLVLHSPVALDEDGMRELDRLGAVKYLIVPNKMHRLDSGVYKARYPGAKVLAPEAARKAANKKVPVEATCESVLPALGIICHRMSGLKAFELAYEFPLKKGKALVLCDALFNLDNLPGFQGGLLKLMGSTGFFGMSLIGRLFLLKDRTRFRLWLEEQGKRRDLLVLSVGHGDAIIGNVDQMLMEAAARLGA